MINIIPVQTAPYPHACLACGSVTRDVVIFDTTQPWNGAMMICTDCFRYVALQFGEQLNLIDRDALSEITEKLALADARKANLDAATTELRQEIELAASRFSDRIDRSNIDPVSSKFVLDLPVS